MIEQSKINRAQFLEFLRIMDVGLRSGYNIKQSMEIFVKDTDNPLTVEVQQLLNELMSGNSLPNVMDHWLARQPNRDLELFVATIHTQIEVGGNLANKLLFLSQLLPRLP
jgi:Flp pilus assembly protein TadB